MQRDEDDMEWNEIEWYNGCVMSETWRRPSCHLNSTQLSLTRLNTHTHTHITRHLGNALGATQHAGAAMVQLPGVGSMANVCSECVEI